MIVEFNLSNLIFLAIAGASAFWAMAKLLFSHFDKSQDARFKGISDILEKNQETAIQLEREFMRFQSEIPRIYLRRDDYVREVQLLQEAIQRDLLPIRNSVTRIEDFLMQK